MADLAASDLTYSFKIVDKHFIGRPGYVAYGTISFGNGSLTYPSGGIPLTKAKMGMPRKIRSLNVVETNATGYQYEYDVSAEKLRLFVTAGFTPAGSVAAPVFTGSALAVHGHVLHLNNADVADSAGARVNAGTNLLGANTGSDISVAAVADTTGVGGIVSISAGTPAGTNSAPAFTGTARAATAPAEATAASFAPAASVLEVEVIGY